MFTLALVSTSIKVDKANDDNVVRVRLQPGPKPELSDPAQDRATPPKEVDCGDVTTSRAAIGSETIPRTAIAIEVRQECTPSKGSGVSNGRIVLSPAEELKMKVLAAFKEDSENNFQPVPPNPPPEEPKETVLEYFSRVYGFPMWDDEAAVGSPMSLWPFPGVNISEQEFVGPYHAPGYLGVSRKQLAEGLIVTISAVETVNNFYMYDHSSSGQLMALETHMNRWYGYYLSRKVYERMGYVFEIVPGGYYAVYLENLKIWARCFVDEVLPSSSDQFYDPSQQIRAVLFDYEGRLKTFERKQFLPLTRAFLSIPVQKTIGKVDPVQANVYPWNTGDLNVIRDNLEGEQFRAVVSNYDMLTEPFAVMTVQLCNMNETAGERKQWRKQCQRMGNPLQPY